MQDYTILATAPDNKTIIEMICHDSQDMNDCIREMKEAGYRDIFAVEVMR